MWHGSFYGLMRQRGVFDQCLRHIFIFEFTSLGYKRSMAHLKSHNIHFILEGPFEFVQARIHQFLQNRQKQCIGIHIGLFHAKHLLLTAKQNRKQRTSSLQLGAPPFDYWPNRFIISIAHTIALDFRPESASTNCFYQWIWSECAHIISADKQIINMYTFSFAQYLWSRSLSPPSHMARSCLSSVLWVWKAPQAPLWHRRITSPLHPNAKRKSYTI